MNKKLVSVLIVSYNSWYYIVNTIKSVLNQTYLDFEVLILDNNSIDNTVKNINSFNDKRIKLFTWNDNLWPYMGLNFLLKKAKWEYIAIQDHDDLWHKDKLNEQINFLEKNKKYIWCWTETIMYYEKDKKYFSYHLWIESYYTIHPSLVFRSNRTYKYDESLDYFWDAYSLKYNLCKWEKCIYNINRPLTLHLIKSSYNNFTYSRFKFKFSYFKRIFELHDFTFYAFLVLFYEIIKKIIFPAFKIVNNYNLYLWFDRIPYKLTWNKVLDINKTNNKYIKEIRDSYL